MMSNQNQGDYPCMLKKNAVDTEVVCYHLPGKRKANKSNSSLDMFDP